MIAAQYADIALNFVVRGLNFALSFLPAVQ